MSNLVKEFEDLGNPFLDESGELFDLDQSVIMPQEVVDCVRNVQTIGEKLYQDFLDKRICKGEVAFSAPMQQCKLKLFQHGLTQPKKHKSCVSTLKDQHAKVTHILLAAQAGRCISDTVFKHESSEYPPSLTRNGRMYHGTKSEIIDCIAPMNSIDCAPNTSCAVLDGPVLVQMLRPGNANTIQDYITDRIHPYILKWFDRNQRIDIVWDVYSKSSLKSSLREQRGNGIRRRVTLSTKIPGNWASFLRVDMNKQELFVELAQSMKNLQLPHVRLYHFLADHDLFHYTFSSLYIIFISSYTISFNKNIHYRESNFSPQS